MAAMAAMATLQTARRRRPYRIPNPEEIPMLSNSTARWLQRRGIHYGWLVAAITFLTMLTMSAALGLPGAMLQPLSREFGWSTEQISSSLALRFALFGLLGPFAAVMMERFGLRAVMCMGLALVGGAMAMVTQATQLWHLFCCGACCWAWARA